MSWDDNTQCAKCDMFCIGTESVSLVKDNLPRLQELLGCLHWTVCCRRVLRAAPDAVHCLGAGAIK